MLKKRGHVWWTWLGLALFGLLLWRLAAPPAPVKAHALLVRSIPEANAELNRPPAAIEMWFSEPLEPGFSSARLLNSVGEEIPAGPARVDPADPAHLTLPLDQLEPGIYTIAWQTLSQADGHEFYGSFPLTILNPDGSRPTGVATTLEAQGRGELPTPGEVIARWLALWGGVLFFGAPLFYSLVVMAEPKTITASSAALVADTRALVLKTMGMAALALILGSWLQIVLLVLRLGELNDLPDLLLGTRTGLLGVIRQSWVLSGLLLALRRLPPIQPAYRPQFWLELIFYHLVVLGLLIGAVIKGEWLVVLGAITVSGVTLAPFLQTPDQSREGENYTRTILLFLAAVVLLSFSISSHASAAPGWIWAVAGDYLHLLAAAAWLGGLALLPLLAWRVRQAHPSLTFASLWPLVYRFSRLATLAIFGLIVTGLFNSLVQLPNLASLWETAYGRVLLVKLALSGLVLGLAFLNHRLVHHRTHPLQTPGAWLRFQRQVTLEAVFSLVLMLSVAVLVQTSKPASLAAGEPPPGQPFDYIAQAGDLSIHFQVLPNRVGRSLFLTHLYHADNSPIGEVQLVRLFFNYREAQLGQATADLEDRGGGTFGIEGAYLNQAGQWDLSIYVRRRSMDDSLAEVSLEVPAPPGLTNNTSPWQNPISSWPAGLIIAGGVGAVGVGCFLWFWLQRRPGLE